MIILVQTNLEGHRAEYISHLLSAKQAIGVNFGIWVRDATVEELRQKYAQINSVVAFASGEFSTYGLSQLEAQEKIDRLIFLDGDASLKTMLRNFASLRKVRTQALLLRFSPPSIANGWLPILKWILKVVSIGIIHAVSKAQFSRLVFVQKSRLGFLGQVRDPLPQIPETAIAPLLRVKKEPYKVGVVGTIDPRKNIQLAAESVAMLGMEFELRLSGEVTPTYKSELNELISQHSQVKVLDAILTEEEMTSEIAILECFLVLQNTNAPSGTLLRALSQGVPVVVGGSRILRSAKKHFPDMVVLVSLNSNSVSQGILKTREMSRHKNSLMPTPQDFASDLIGEKI